MSRVNYCNWNIAHIFQPDLLKALVVQCFICSMVLRMNVQSVRYSSGYPKGCPDWFIRVDDNTSLADLQIQQRRHSKFELISTSNTNSERPSGELPEGHQLVCNTHARGSCGSFFSEGGVRVVGRHTMASLLRFTIFIITKAALGRVLVNPKLPP